MNKDQVKAVENILSDYKRQVTYCSECLDVINDNIDDESARLLMAQAHSELLIAATTKLKTLLEMRRDNIPESIIVTELVVAHNKLNRLSKEYERLARLLLNNWGCNDVELPVR